MKRLDTVTDRQALEGAYLSLGTEARKVFDWCIKTLGFRLHGMKPLPKGRTLWVFYAPGTGGVHDVVELKQSELRWRHVFGLASTYDYQFGLRVRELFNEYVQQHGGHL